MGRSRDMAGLIANMQSNVWQTGDVKLAINDAADSGWLLMNGESIGATGSGADNAGDDYEALFLHLWGKVSNTYAPVSSGRGASAAADWAAGKTLTMSNPAGRMLLGVGQGSTAEGGGTGTSRALGEVGGAETHTLTTSEIAEHQHEVSGKTDQGSTWEPYGTRTGTRWDYVGGGGGGAVGDTTNQLSSADGGGGDHNNMSPFIALLVQIKL